MKSVDREVRTGSSWGWVMGTIMRTHIWSGAGAALVLALVGGCVAAPSASSESTLVLGDVEPLATLAEADWQAAPLDCAGLTGASVSFRVASLEGGLVACVDAAGEIICVDSVEAVSSELDGEGRQDAAEEVAAGFGAAVHAEDVAQSVPGMTSDPEPQPNTRPRGIGDPEPQPN